MITTTMDKAGRVVLPKQIRDELQLGPGDSLELETVEDRIILRPARGGGRIYKDRGMWVLDRKSTRLNSSHEWISYAVFCLKKKRKANETETIQRETQI